MDIRERNEKKRKLAKLLKYITDNYSDYDKRYIYILKALVKAKELGYTCGFRCDEKEIQWPVIVIDLEGFGQVSWHMPPSGIEYDNSTQQDCRDRCLKFFLEHKGEEKKRKYDK